MGPHSLSTLVLQSIEKSFQVPETCGNSFESIEFVNYFNYLLMCDGNHQLQYQVAKLLAKMTENSEKFTKIVVESGAFHQLSNLLSSPNEELVEVAIETLGNIIADNIKYRDLLLQLDILKPLLSLVSDDKSSTLKNKLALAFVNIVRCFENPPPLNVIIEIVPKLCQLVEQQDVMTKINALWAMTFIADSPDDYKQVLVDFGVVEQVIPMLMSVNEFVDFRIMLLLCSISMGTKEQVQVLVDNRILENIHLPLIHPNSLINRVTLGCLANICLGTPDRVQQVLDAQLLSLICFNFLQEDAKNVFYAVLAFKHLISSGSVGQILEIIKADGLINVMKKLLRSEDRYVADCVRLTLERLCNVMEFAFPQIFK